MKNKLRVYFLTSVFINFTIFSVLLILIFNYQNEENIKKNLKFYNETIIYIADSNYLADGNGIIDFNLLFPEDSKNLSTKSIVFSKDKELIYPIDIYSNGIKDKDFYTDLFNDISNNNEYLIKHNKLENKNVVYYSSTFKNSDIIISYEELNSISLLQNKYLTFCLFALILSLFFTILIFNKLYSIVIKPLAYLQYITYRIANGEMDIRGKVSEKEEISKVTKNINEIANKLQETLKDSIEKQNKLEAILKSMDSGVIAIDANYRIIMINPYAEKIFGIKKNIIGQNLLDIIRNHELEDILKNNNDQYREIKILWPKERELRIKTADIINGNERIGTVAVVQDISDIKALENMRSQFITNVSHELKTPLTSIMGFSETLKDVDDPKLREKFLSIINDEAERLTRLINDILSLSSIEHKKMNKIEHIAVDEVVQDVYNLMKNIADSKKILLTVECKSTPNIVGDSDEFKQMLINLVDNAIKYSEEGSRVTIGTDLNDVSFILWVEDTGLGIPPNHLERLFERFYRVDKARSRDKGGTGLGLAIVKHIVMNFGGTIVVNSEVGKGSKFTVKIPL